MYVMDKCRCCGYEFKPQDEISPCLICHASRDTYKNLAKEWSCTRQEAKMKVYHLMFKGVTDAGIEKTKNKLRSYFTPTGKTKIFEMSYPDMEQRILNE